MDTTQTMAPKHHPRHPISLGLFRFFIFCGIFFIAINGAVFSAEDLTQLMAQGEFSIIQGNYQQALLTGLKILSQDPRNLTGYKFLLIYSVSIGNDVVFYKTVEEAKKQGVSELEMDKLVVQLLFLGNHLTEASAKLVEYERRWDELHG